jgi:hypothetical protein
MHGAHADDMIHPAALVGVAASVQHYMMVLA